MNSREQIDVGAQRAVQVFYNGGRQMSLFISQSQGQQVGQQDIKQYWRLMVIAVGLCFVVVAVSRLLHVGTRTSVATTGKPETVYQEARRMACTVLPYAFMN